MNDLPEPCTQDALDLGCKCYTPAGSRWHFEPPEPRRAYWCPLHGAEEYQVPIAVLIGERDEE